MPKKPKPEMSTCGSCRCFVEDRPKSDEGECRLFPRVPVVVADVVTFVYPRHSRNTDSCGQYAVRLQS